MSQNIYLVSCVGKKLSAPAPARELYTSPWFRKARAYVERTGHPWFVLSAKHGLVSPDEMLDPYDVSLDSMGVADRRLWAGRVLTQLEPHLEGVTSVTFLAFTSYREFLEPSLRRRGLAICIPMEGLKIGEQLSWLSRNTLG